MTRIWPQARRERLGGYVVHHPILTAVWITLVVAVAMTPVLLILVAPELRVAMSSVAAVTLGVCFVICAVALRTVLKDVTL